MQKAKNGLALTHDLFRILGSSLFPFRTIRVNETTAGQSPKKRGNMKFTELAGVAHNSSIQAFQYDGEKKVLGFKTSYSSAKCDKEGNVWKRLFAKKDANPAPEVAVRQGYNGRAGFPAAALPFFFLLIVSAGHMGSITGATIPRPNIIFILVDDLRWDGIGYNGNRHIRTPGIDRIAEEGMSFNYAHTTTPLCSPSRAGFFYRAPYQHTPDLQ